MDKGYADTLRLLLSVAPEVFANDIFAMTALVREHNQLNRSDRSGERTKPDLTWVW